MKLLTLIPLLGLIILLITFYKLLKKDKEYINFTMYSDEELHELYDNFSLIIYDFREASSPYIHLCSFIWTTSYNHITLIFFTHNKPTKDKHPTFYNHSAYNKEGRLLWWDDNHKEAYSQRLKFLEYLLIKVTNEIEARNYYGYSKAS